MTTEEKYHQLYDRLLEEVAALHQSNQRRIRVGMRALVVVTLGLMLLMFLAEGNKVFTLILWILSMFALAAYLIGVDYMDYELQKKLRRSPGRPPPNIITAPPLRLCRSRTLSLRRMSRYPLHWTWIPFSSPIPKRSPQIWRSWPRRCRLCHPT